MVGIFQAIIGGKFASLINLWDDDTDIHSVITTHNTAVTDTTGEIIGKELRRKMPRVIRAGLDFSEARRNLKRRYKKKEQMNTDKLKKRYKGP